jgi:hypothetical protein
MSVLNGAILREKISDVVIHVVAGTLHVEGDRVFGQTADHIDRSGVPRNSNRSWDGHCSMMCGDFIPYISFFRTVYSPKPTRWRGMLFANKGGGLLVSKPEQGLRYELQDVLTEPQITALGRGAVHLMRNPPRSKITSS